uniref:Serpentine receptor class gamma n=1 Tax=Globodera rostochiensis TaxID=31243 RepID=A0A914HXA1_GLORO
MELYLFRPVEYQQLYNCSSYKIEDVPLASRTHTALGVSFIMQFVLFELCYIPCMFSIWKHRAQACYKFMFFIGIVDILCLVICSFMHGYFAVTGAVFCSHPDLIYWSGVIGFFFWVIESSVDILLAINRCVEMTSPIWGKRLYNGRRAWLWLIPPSIYAAYIALTQMPVLFNGIYFAWFFNPHVGYIDDFGTIYYNNWQTFHNWLVTVGLSSSYLIFTTIFFYKTSSGGFSRSTTAQKATFLQVLAISAVNTICGLIYIYMQFFRISDFLIYLASFLWVWAHGLPSLIYLTMNKTIRRDIVLMLDPNKATATMATTKVVPMLGTTHAAGVSTTKKEPKERTLFLH